MLLICHNSLLACFEQAPGFKPHVVFVASVCVCIMQVFCLCIAKAQGSSQCSRVGGKTVNRKARLFFFSICSVFTHWRPQVVFAPFLSFMEILPAPVTVITHSSLVLRDLLWCIWAKQSCKHRYFDTFYSSAHIRHMKEQYQRWCNMSISKLKWI